jgi:hypothetical protein
VSVPRNVSDQNHQQYLHTMTRLRDAIRRLTVPDIPLFEALVAHLTAAWGDPKDHSELSDEDVRRLVMLDDGDLLAAVFTVTEGRIRPADDEPGTQTLRAYLRAHHPVLEDAVRELDDETWAHRCRPHALEIFTWTRTTGTGTSVRPIPRSTGDRDTWKETTCDDDDDPR